MKSEFAIVDIETTGGSPQQSRVTEIAIYISNGVEQIDQFETLINPEQPIPSFITKLTGITNEMVVHSPKFDEVSTHLAKLTKNAIFVAHNAAFDYGMLRSEYRELGMDFHRRVLCTVKTSRKLLPGHNSYSLGNICKDLGIEIQNRHRASGDAYATMNLFHLMYAHKQNELLSLIEDGLPRVTGDPRTDELIREVPESTGVYYLLDHNKDVVYVGSGTNIRKKVLHHFTRKSTRLTFALRNSITDINFTITGSALLAEILELAEVKRLRPVFNRKLKTPLIEMRKNGIRYIIDKGPDRFTKSIIRLTEDQVGWGFFQSDLQLMNKNDLDLFVKYVAIGKEFPLMIENYLKKNRVEAIL